MTQISSFTGEFRNRTRESAFQADHLPESRRHARLLFMLSALLNALFLISDWRFAGTPHFWVAVPARVAVVLWSLFGEGGTWPARHCHRPLPFAALSVWQKHTAAAPRALTLP